MQAEHPEGGLTLRIASRNNSTLFSYSPKERAREKETTYGLPGQPTPCGHKPRCGVVAPRRGLARDKPLRTPFRNQHERMRDATRAAYGNHQNPANWC